MAGLSTSSRNSLLDVLVNGTAWAADAARYLSLHTADPGTTGASEVTGSAYARVDVTASFPNAAAGLCSNDVAITFPTVTTTGYTVTHWGLWSAATAGTFRAGGDVSPDKVLAVGGIPEFAIGELDLAAS